jgi:copper oxidase (laccase) domain-containing protein
MGWRAFTNGLFEKAMTYFDVPSRTDIWVGPHIGFSSFQVDEGTAKTILQTQKLNLKTALRIGLARTSIDKKNHWFVNLLGLLKRQAQKNGFMAIHHTSINTFDSPIHFSHRRNRWRTGTNYSFIVKA